MTCAGTSLTQRVLSQALGSLMRCGWPLQKGYKILVIYEVYEYAVTQYDPKTSQGGLFVQYINTFVKLKAEASAYTDWVRTSDDEDKYEQAFWKSEGIRLNKDDIKYNAAKRGSINCV
jgi:hypothetical protein